MKNFLSIVIFLLLFAPFAGAQSIGAIQHFGENGVIRHFEVVSDTVRVHFRQGYRILEPRFADNQAQLDRIGDILSSHHATDTVYKLISVEIVGGASPEANLRLNQRLSYNRANVLFSHFEEYGVLPDSVRQYTFLGRDWGGLLALAEADPDLPYREETLEFLRDIVARCVGGEKDEDRNLDRMIAFRGGKPYWYMYDRMFPDLRASHVVLTYEREPEIIPIVTHEAKVTAKMPVVFPEPIYSDPVELPIVRKKPFYMSLHTNMLYDAALVPNIGAEFYLGKNWTLHANWKYSWWKSDRRHNYWRIYGGNLGVRKYFGSLAQEKPLQGHHLGVYAQILTYDFELGGKGYIGGHPGCSLWEKFHYGASVEYGYTMPIKRRLNLDFTIGLGYQRGEYWEYHPVDNHYVWLATKNRNWFGPTKLEISLVWLIGEGNYNDL